MYLATTDLFCMTHNLSPSLLTSTLTADKKEAQVPLKALVDKTRQAELIQVAAFLHRELPVKLGNATCSIKPSILPKPIANPNSPSTYDDFLPSALANRARELETNDLFKRSKSIMTVVQWYKQSFRAILQTPAPINTTTEAGFAGVIGHLFQSNTSHMITMARGAYELRTMLQQDTAGFAGHREIHRLLDEFYASRIDIRTVNHPHHSIQLPLYHYLHPCPGVSIVITIMSYSISYFSHPNLVSFLTLCSCCSSVCCRLLLFVVVLSQLIGQYLSLRKPSKDPHTIGLVTTNASPYDIAHEAIAEASELCTRVHGDAPEVTIHGRTDLTFPYISAHISYIMQELLKNSMRATVETHGVDKMPPIRIIISDGEGNEDVVIKISDEGGGIKRSNMNRIWSYLYTTADPEVLQRMLEREEGSNDASPLAGLGYGLPLAKNYARYVMQKLHLFFLDIF